MHPILEHPHRTVLHAAAWLIVGALLGLLLRTLMAVPWLGAMALALPMAIVAAPISLSAWFLCRAMPLRRETALRVVTSTTGAAIVTAAIWAGVGYGWHHVLVQRGVDFGGASPVSLATLLVGFGALTYVLSIAIHYLFLAFQSGAETEQRLLRAEITAREAELRALRAQVDPHFLFNSLNAITGLISVDAMRARAMGQLLAEFLRETLTLGRADRITLDREFGLARRYLEIEQARFGARLSVVMSVSDDVANALVPPLIIQPLVENAVRHGIASCLSGGEVSVAASRSGDYAVIVIGNPRDAEARKEHGTGLGHDIVRRRLHATFGDEAALAIAVADDAYRVTLTLPAEFAGGEERVS